MFAWIVYRTDGCEPMGVFATAECAYNCIKNYGMTYFVNFEVLKKQFLDSLEESYNLNKNDFCAFCTTSWESSYTVYATRYEITDSH